MKTSLYSLLCLGLLATLANAMAADRSVHLRPTSDSPVIGSVSQDAFLIAPAEPVTLSNRELERGWEAISFLENFRGFVQRTDLTKDLKVAPGSAVYVNAEVNSDKVLTRARANDLFEVENLSGNWAEVSFRKPVTAFVRSESSTASAPREAARAVQTSDIQDEPEQRAEATQRPTVSRRTAIPSDGMVRSFQGQLGQPRTLFGRQAPYPFQIVDSSGNRIAYLDLSKLLITAPMEHLIGRQYEFYGKAEPIDGRRDFVIRVERIFQK